MEEWSPGFGKSHSDLWHAYGNYKMAMGAQDAGPNWLGDATGIFAGRASAINAKLG